MAPVRGRWRWWRRGWQGGGRCAGAGILIATSREVVAGQSLGGDTTAVFGTGLVDGVSGAGKDKSGCCRRLATWVCG